MKKIISIITTTVLLTAVIFTVKSFAAPLNTITIDTDKTTVRPGETVTLTIEFGQTLGAYTFDVNYDNNIFEYVSVDGGQANDTTDKVKVVFHDQTGGTAPRTNMSIVFKAKEDITTSNPTELTVTAEGLANADASETYDDITTPLVKNLTVEPEYIDYTINLEHTGNIIKEQAAEMKLSYSSSMGRYYEHARLIGEVVAPAGATAQLIGTDDAQAEHDIIQSGWGDPQGYKIGGKDVLQELNVRGIFTDEGEYQITLKLIDRDNSDQVIAENTFAFTVLAEEPVVTPPAETTPEPTTPINPSEPTQTETPNQTPTELPRTGQNLYIGIMAIIAGLLGIYAYYNKKTTK